MILTTKIARTIVDLEDTEDIATQHMNQRKYEVAFEPTSPFPKFGIPGRIFGFGDLLIESAGELGQEKFKGLPEPLKIQGMIEAEIRKIPSSLI